MLERVQRDPAGILRRRIAEMERDEAVRGLVQCNRQNDRHREDQNLIDEIGIHVQFQFEQSRLANFHLIDLRLARLIDYMGIGQKFRHSL
jgi:hypothetical protein